MYCYSEYRKYDIWPLLRSFCSVDYCLELNISRMYSITSSNSQISKLFRFLKMFLNCVQYTWKLKHINSTATTQREVAIFMFSLCKARTAHFKIMMSWVQLVLSFRRTRVHYLVDARCLL